jgi:hypothetical protein
MALAAVHDGIASHHFSQTRSNSHRSSALELNAQAPSEINFWRQPTAQPRLFLAMHNVTKHRSCARLLAEKSKHSRKLS